MSSDHTKPTPAEIEETKRLCAEATEGPWSYESCGEKGDGAAMIGVSFPVVGGDVQYLPCSGYLEPFDDEGEEIEYYRDCLVAVCDYQRTRTDDADAAFIAHARTALPKYVAAYEQLEAENAELRRDRERFEFWFSDWHWSPDQWRAHIDWVQRESEPNAAMAAEEDERG